jgi:hypothetical protein
MDHPEYRIPKINVPLTCLTVQGERIAGDIFVDVLLTEGYNVEQVLDYFNTPSPFFPIRTGDSAPVLLSKESVAIIEVPQLLGQFREDTSTFSTRKEATLHFHHIGPVRALIIVDLPEEYSRILDLVNMAKRAFFPAIVNDSLSLLSIKHIYKIEGN